MLTKVVHIFIFAFMSTSAAYIAHGIYADVRARKWWNVWFGAFAILLPAGFALSIAGFALLAPGKLEIKEVVTECP